MIKFTLITVTYNADATLERTLQSVAGQTYPHIEHILIDGASKDRTLEIAKQYPHLAKVVSEPDRGLYDAMNKGLRLATGDYVCFLNAGDKLHGADTLEKISLSLTLPQREGTANATVSESSPFGGDGGSFGGANATVSEPSPSGGDGRGFGGNSDLPGVLYGHTDIVDNDGKFLHPRRLTPPERLTWKSFKQGMLVCHQAFYARRDLCPEYDTTFRFSADFDWCIRVMKQTDNLVHLPFPVADYLQEGMTTRNHRASLIERFRLMCRHYGVLPTLAQHLWFVVRAIVR